MSRQSDSEDTDTGQSRGWRDDPLSVFLFVSAVVLGAMYGYDQWQRTRLTDQMARADQIAQGFAVDGVQCQVASSGLEGETLVIACDGLPVERIESAVGEIDALKTGPAGFERVVLRGADAMRRCPPEPERWQAECTTDELPDHSSRE